MIDEFGKAVRPIGGFSNIERHKFPKSLQKLTKESAALLKRYLVVANDGFVVSQTIHLSVVVLWLIDEAGDCWYCIEEMYKADSTQKIFPRLNEVEYPDGYEKLGHPSLIEAKKARIGGEILWDGKAAENGNGWVISNKSGRYGLREDIVESHLVAAKDFFQSFGISMKHHYVRYEP